MTIPLQDLWVEMLRYIGLDQFRSETLRLPSGDYSVCLEHRVDASKMAFIHGSPDKILETVLRPISDRVKSSPAVKDALAGKDKEVLSLQAKVMELEQQVKDSERYRAYFEAEFLLRHGKEISAND